MYSRVRPVRTGRPPDAVVRLSGTGYRGFVGGRYVVTQLGYSHYVGVALPTGASARAGRGQVALHPVGHLTPRLAGLRRVDPYKAIGTYLSGVVPRRKEGKRR